MPAEVIAVDVGGTAIKAAMVTAEGTAARHTRIPTPPAGTDGAPVIEAIATAVESMLADGTRPTAVGVVVPGLVDEAAGIAVMAENLGWRDVPLRELLARRLGCPVALGHDVRGGGLAEQRAGTFLGAGTAAFVPVGTGVAAAILVEGRTLSADGYAGEVGHIDVGHDLPCACGGRGCLEAIASAAAVARRYTEATGVLVAGSLEVASRVRAREPAAVAVWSDALEALSSGLAALTGIVAPEVIAVGGGLSESADLVIAPLAERLTARLTFHRVPRVVAARLGDRAGCVGAGLLAWELIA